jgi:hypothetical protein
VAAIARERIIEANFDRRADVLYLSLGKPRDDEGEDGPRGVILRFGADDGHPSGVTVIGYIDNGWPRDIDELAAIASVHLAVRKADVIKAIKGAAQV